MFVYNSILKGDEIKDAIKKLLRKDFTMQTKSKRNLYYILQYLIKINIKIK